MDPGGPFPPPARTSSGFSENGSATTVMARRSYAPRRRFTPKGSFSSIYLASDPITALMEIVSVFDHPNWARSSSPRAVPWTLFTVDGVVANLIDLADAETQELLGTNDQELSGIWLTVDKPTTQVLGQAAFSDGSIARIRYRSAKNHRDGFCIVNFEDRLGLSSHNYLEVYDPAGRLDQRLS
jgi:hypothetical protein